MLKSQLPIVVAANGPPQIGKGWFCNQLSKVFGEHCRVMSLAAPIKEEVLAQYEWKYDYESFKKFKFENGETGRDKLIELGLRRRQEDVHYWARRLTDSIYFLSRPIILVDDLGFPSELDWLLEHSSGFIPVIIAPSDYTVGCLFRLADGTGLDSRQCLSPLNSGFRAINSDRALELFMKRINGTASREADYLDSQSIATWERLRVVRSLVSAGD